MEINWSCKTKQQQQWCFLIAVIITRIHMLSCRYNKQNSNKKSYVLKTIPTYGQNGQNILVIFFPTNIFYYIWYSVSLEDRDVVKNVTVCNFGVCKLWRFFIFPFVVVGTIKDEQGDDPSTFLCTSHSVLVNDKLVIKHQVMTAVAIQPSIWWVECTSVSMWVCVCVFVFPLIPLAVKWYSWPICLCCHVRMALRWNPHLCVVKRTGH